VKFTVYLGPELEFGPTEEPDVMLAMYGRMPVYITQCGFCGQWKELVHTLPDGGYICDDCGCEIANVWNKAHTGRFLTWTNPTSKPKVAGRERISQTLRSQIFLRDGYRCRYCGGFEGGLVLDHVHPWSKGGPDTVDNLVAACATCNSRKGDRTPAEAGLTLREVAG